jgi:predicted ATPase with chaperone activity
MAIVGLPDKAVSEARERVRSALIASGLALPARRITVNLAPADVPKEGSHYDLPIALGLMAAIGAIPPKRCRPVFTLSLMPFGTSATFRLTGLRTKHRYR